MSILIKNGIILTYGEGPDLITDGSVYIENDRIIEIGKTEAIASRYKAEHVIDATWKIVSPGFINSHSHTDGDTLSRGYGLDAALALDFFKSFKWPRILTMKPDDYYVGALGGYVDAIRTGTTTLADNYYGPKGVDTSGVPRAAEEVGIRSILVRGFHNISTWMPPEFLETPEFTHKQYEKLYTEWNGRGDGRLKAWIGPVNLAYCTEESLLKLKELSQRTGMGFHTHVAEEKSVVEEVKRRFNAGYIEVFSRLGILGPKFQGAHCVHISEQEINLMSTAGASAVHSPVPNALLASGIAPVAKMRKAGVNVALGTNTRMDILSAMKFATGLAKLNSMNPLTLTARDVFQMATLNGAKAYGMDQETGSLKAGKKADITIMNLKRSYATPYVDPIMAMVYYLNGGDVDTVIVDGKIVMEEGVIKTVDEGRVIEMVQERAADLTSRMNQMRK